MTQINGILLLDKPLGISSNAALQRAKKLFKASKAGHTGSLDPLATGMLPICFGEATKFSQFLLEANKSYRVTGKLGVKTTTGDAEGEIIHTQNADFVTLENIKDLLPQFRGQIEQIPPMYSALKYKGKPLYQLARAGIEVDRQPRTVTIFNLELTQLYSSLFTLEVTCSKGTYIRTLVEDIGNLLGCGAHVVELRRLMISPYQKHTSFTFDQLESLKEENINAFYNLLLSIESSVIDLPAVKLSNASIFYLQQGQSVQALNHPVGWVRIYSNDEKFIGVGEILADGRLTPRRLIKAAYNNWTKN